MKVSELLLAMDVNKAYTLDQINDVEKIQNDLLNVINKKHMDKELTTIELDIMTSNIVAIKLLKAYRELEAELVSKIV